MNACLIIMARQPVPGQAKTRLIPDYGETGAADIADFLLHDTVNIARQAWPGEIVLSVAPDCDHPAVQQLCDFHNIACHSQCDGDLGKRMQYEIEQVVSQGRYAVLIGTDVPHALKQALSMAWNAARDGGRAVIGPSNDGGYYLLGLNQVYTSLFSNIAWSSDQVYARTRDVLEQEHCDFIQLPLAYDIDTAEDLRLVAAYYKPLQKYV